MTEEAATPPTQTPSTQLAEETWELWLCPKCGPIDEGLLIQGRDPSLANASDPDGWTETYYCDRCNSEASYVEVVPLSRALQAERERDDLHEARRGRDGIIDRLTGELDIAESQLSEAKEALPCATPYACRSGRVCLRLLHTNVRCKPEER